MRKFALNRHVEREGIWRFDFVVDTPGNGEAGIHVIWRRVWVGDDGRN